LIGLKLSQSELAQMLGVTREAVNKQLHAWADKNVLKLDKGKVVVRDMSSLKRAAEPARE
jgi:CRP-like cAMP-binding protein